MIFEWNSRFFLWFSKLHLLQKLYPVNYYRNPYSKWYKLDFTFFTVFSLKSTLSVDVRTSYSTSSQYYFPLTARGIWSPYVKGKCGFGWYEGLKSMPKLIKMLWVTARVVLFNRNSPVLAWFWDLRVNQNHTFPWRTDFIFHEVLEENSTTSSWNMKSIRQRKVLIWEKTLWKKWNLFCTIYCRGSYSNSPDRAFGANTISRIIRKIVNFIRKSRMWGILISKPPKKSCFACSNWCYHQLQMSSCAMDFAH